MAESADDLASLLAAIARGRESSTDNPPKRFVALLQQDQAAPARLVEASRERGIVPATAAVSGGTRPWGAAPSRVHL